MTRVERNLVERLLRLKLQELRWYSRLCDIAVDHVPDELDQCQRASERDLSLAAIEREVALANQIRLALDRLENGEYGICLLCEEEIGQKRLAAVPWASTCVICQGRLEAERTPVEPLRWNGSNGSFNGSNASD
ncbi:MAG: TraR/DksA family transcriptional regulator [Bryobacterales bacterium]|nr:TraR/DksA family transcriptional regulator [Bryobacterales bacterium]